MQTTNKANLTVNNMVHKHDGGDLACHQIAHGYAVKPCPASGTGAIELFNLMRRERQSGGTGQFRNLLYRSRTHYR
ncbi:hypothetical protein DZS_18050 [Dickeya ananatis]